MSRLKHFCGFTAISIKLINSKIPYVQRNLLKNGLEFNQISSRNIFPIRLLSTAQGDDDGKIVSYEDIITYENKPNIIFIDVREPEELEKTGGFPACINIPMGSLDEALKTMGDADFENKYGRNVPNKNIELVFTCQIGVRAKKAMEIAIQMGYPNSKYYKGSWVDYVSKKKL